MSEWKEYKIDEIASILNNKRVPLSSMQRANRKGKYPYYGASGIVDYIDDFIFDGDYVLISEDGENLRSRNTPIAFFARGKFWVNNHSHIIKGKSDAINKWIIYSLKNLDINPYLTGAVQPKLNKENLLTIPFLLPNSDAELNDIVSILSSLDDKIELNNKINQELESLAQLLFKRWFVDFEFPNENGEPYKSSGGEMIDSELDKIADYLNGLALQKFPAESDSKFLPVIKIKELRQKDVSNSDKASINIPEKYIVNDGDVLFSWSGSLMIDFWTNGKGALNQHLFKVTSEYYPKWYYYMWTKYHLLEFIEIAESKATTMGHIQRQHLTNAKVLVPDSNRLSFFSLVYEPIISKIIDARIENKELIALRDTLLPKLITGELQINEN
jgi:type I restriction enzyme S subunit